MRRFLHSTTQPVTLLMLAMACAPEAPKEPGATDTATSLPLTTWTTLDTPPCIPDDAGECDCGFGATILSFADLEYWSPCTVISGLELIDTDITHFPEMALRRVGSLQLFDNEELVSMEGLEGLTEATKWIRVHNSSRLASLAGFDSLRTTPELSVIGNHDLEDVSALSSLESARLVEFVDNRSLCKPHVEEVLADADIRELLLEGGLSHCDE